MPEAELPSSSVQRVTSDAAFSSTTSSPVSDTLHAPLIAGSMAITALQTEIALERRRLAELELSLGHFQEANKQQTHQLGAMRSQNAELSVRISTSANDRSAADARLVRYRKDAETLAMQQQLLENVSVESNGAIFSGDCFDGRCSRAATVTWYLG